MLCSEYHCTVVKIKSGFLFPQLSSVNQQAGQFLKYTPHQSCVGWPSQVYACHKSPSQIMKQFSSYFSLCMLYIGVESCINCMLCHQYETSGVSMVHGPKETKAKVNQWSKMVDTCILGDVFGWFSLPLNAALYSLL